MNGYQTGLFTVYRGFSNICYLFLTVMLFVGCNNDRNESEQESESKNKDAKLMTPGIPADEFFRLVQSRYENAEQYSDNAKLTLAYSLDGQPFKEFYSCGVAFKKPLMLTASLFNVRVIANERRLVSYVFDSATFNLDGQHIVKPVEDSIPIEELLEDSIWSHYGCGSSELPIDAAKEGNTQFISPLLQFFTGINCANWLTSKNTVWKYDGIETIHGNDCWKLSADGDNRHYRVWIDQKEQLIRAIQIPGELLTGVGSDANILDNMKIMFEIDDATWHPDLVANQFKFDGSANWKPVRKFIPVPQKFPTNLIGEHRPSFSFSETNGQTWSPDNRKSLSTIITWTPAAFDAESLKMLAELASQHKKSDFLVAHTMPEFRSDLVEFDANQNLFAVLDPNAENARRFGIEAFPSVVIIGPFGKIQYAQAPLEDDWLERVAGTINRLNKGEEVANEMKQSYGQFVAKYQEQIKLEREAIGQLTNNE